MAMKTTHQISIGNVTRELPVREVAPGVRVALFSPLGDWELTEAAGIELAKRIPAGTEVLVMPDGKAQALLHVLGRVSHLPTIVARKEKKAYMAEPVLTVAVRSITTQREQRLYIGADDTARLTGMKVVMVDDVISTGGTLLAMCELLVEAGAELIGVMAVLTEGEPRSDVIALDHLPLF
jgi:adenine phosphoribosyltransferase